MDAVTQIGQLFVRLFKNLAAAGGQDALTLLGTLLGMAVMALVCFFGLRYFRFWCAVGGFVLLYTAGNALGGWLHLGVYAFVLGIACGIVGAVLAYRVVRVGVFLLCLLCSLAVLHLLGLELLMALIGALVIALLAMWLTDTLLILTTGVFGGMQLGVALAGLLHVNGLWQWGLCALLAISGVCLQLYQHTHRKHKNK